MGNDPINLIDPEGESARAAAKAALAGIATDVAIPEPSDALPHKWVGYAIVGTVAGITLAVTNDSHSKGKTDVAPITGAKTNTDSKREDSFVVRLQAQGSLIGEHSVVLTGSDPIPATEVQAGLASLESQLTNTQQKVLSGAFSKAALTVDRAAQAGGVPSGYSKSHYVAGVSGDRARVDIESKVGQGNIK